LPHLAQRVEGGAPLNVHIEKSRNGSGAVRLKNKGFEKDIETCLRVDVTEIIPVYKQGKIINSI